MTVRRPLKFAQFSPDTEDYDTPAIESLVNGIPMYGGYRAIRVLENRAQTTQFTSVVATGAYAHLLSDDFNEQHSRAITGTTAADWVESGLTADATTFPPEINEGTPNDSTYIMFLDSTQNYDGTGLGYHVICKLADLVDPTVHTGHVMNLRYRGFVDSGVLTLYARLYEDTTVRDGTTFWNDDSTSTPELEDGIWLFKEVTLDTTDMANITDYTDLYVHFYLKFTGMTAANPDLVIKPTEDIQNVNGWMGDGDQTESLWTFIDSVTAPGGTPDDNRYVYTGDITGNETSVYKFRLDNLQPRPMDKWYTHGAQSAFGYTADYKIRAKVKDKDLTTMSVKFKDKNTGEYVFPTTNKIEDHTFTTNDTWEDITKTLTDSEYVNFNLDDVYVEVSFTHTGGTGTPQSVEPDADQIVGNWKDEGDAAVNLYQSINDDDDNTWIYVSGTAKESYKTRVPSMDDPESYADGDVTITVRAEGTSGTPKFDVELEYDGGSFKKTFDSQSEITDHVWSLTGEEAAALDWGTPWFITISKQKTSQSRTLRVYEVDVDAGPVAGIGYVSDFWMELQGFQGAQISWQDLKVPAATAEILGDQQKIFIGTETELYEADDNGFTDRTRSGDDYGQDSNRTPQAWDFCSWGGNVIATNYEDEVQILNLETAGTLFEDLHQGTGTEEYDVRCKFVDVVKNHLVCANIRYAEDFGTPTEYTDVYSYSVWWSAINDPTTMRIGDYSNLSDLEHLRQTRGEITGFVGGEYGTIFKRDSIYRMSWVGGNLVFRFDVLANGIGTSHPKSIVARDQDIYFYGHNDFYVMPNGGKPVPLGFGKIQSMLVEVGFDRRSVNRSEVTSQVQNDLRITGAYDQFSGLIFWAVDNGVSTSDWEHKTDIIVFSPLDGRFGYIRDSSLDTADYGVGLLVATPNIPSDEPYMLNNLYVVVNDSTVSSKDEIHLNKFASTTVNSMDISSGILSSGGLGASTESCSLNSVRPFFSRLGDYAYTSDSSGTVFTPPYSGTVYCSPDPLMIDSVSSATFSSGRVNENGWAQLSRVLHGEFWKFEINIPSYDTVSRAANSEEWIGLVKTILGLQVEVQEDGMR